MKLGTRNSAPESPFMAEAIQLAIDGMNAGRGGPFGAVVVQDGQIVGRGNNRVTSTNDPTAHAEVVAIRDACQRLGRFHLDGCKIYASCEPCPMCLAAIYWSHIDRIYFGGTAADAEAAGFSDAEIRREFLLPPESRRIPMTQTMHAEAAAVFAAWNAKPDRTMY